MERVVNIIGMGASARNTPDTGENWGINVAYKYAKLDKMFFFDDFDVIMWDDTHNTGSRDVNIKQALDENPKLEIYSRFPDGIKENGVKFADILEFPLNKAVTLMPGAYFTSTVAYVIAYAIIEKVDRIRMYGFEMYSRSCANEYTYQIPCVEFWLAFAMGRGIKVDMPFQTIFQVQNKQNLYGYTMQELCDPRNREDK